MNIIEFYTALLESLDLSVDKNGLITVPVADNKVIKVAGNPLVLPLKKYLEANEWDEVTPFHPLCEDALMGQSPVYHKLMVLIRASLTLRYSQLIRDILKVGLSKELQKQIKDPAANEILTAFADMKKGALTSWKNIAESFSKDNFFIKMYVSRNAKIEDIMYQRSGKLSFPMLKDTELTSILSVPTSKKDTAGIRAIVSRVLDPIPDRFLSNAATPYFDVAMQYYKAMALRYNELLDMFGNSVNDGNYYNLDWIEGFTELERFRKRIPKLPHNAGVRLKTDDDDTDTTSSTPYDRDATPEVKPEPVSKEPVIERKVESATETPPWSESTNTLSNVLDNKRPRDREATRPREVSRPSNSISDMLHPRSAVADRYERPDARSDRRDRLIGGRSVRSRDTGRSAARGSSIRDLLG